MKPTHLVSAFCVVALLASLAPPVALAKLRQTGVASVQFKDAGTVGGLVVTGTSNGVILADNGTTVTLTVPLDSVKTGRPVQDKQLQSTLEVRKYPTASFKVGRKSLTFLSRHRSASGAARGSLTLHGSTQPVKIEYHETLANGTYRVKLTASIDVENFGVKPPSLLGVGYDSEVQLSSTFSAIDR